MTNSSIVYSADPGLIIGFHGCEEWVRDNVISGKINLNPSRNEWDWLEEGIYFWQNNYERALDYATNPPPGVTIAKPAVLGAVFSLGNCLDFIDREGIEAARSSYGNLKDLFAKQGKILPSNTNPPGDPNSTDKVIRRLDCAVIKNLHALMKGSGMNPFDSVRGLFLEGDPIYEGAGFRDKTHVQVCIRNPNCIKGYFMPRLKVQWP
jgi:hypothetical protein